MRFQPKKQKKYSVEEIRESNSQDILRSTAPTAPEKEATFTPAEIRMMAFARKDIIGIFLVLVLIVGLFGAVFLYDKSQGSLDEFAKTIAKATGLIK